MSDRIESITIVGGGTAGWLTALILNTHLNRDIKERRIAIALIESPKVPTIGVGESTIQNLKSTFQRVGIDEAELIRRCNASFKLAVRYVDWSRGGATVSSNYYHPLNATLVCGGVNPVYHFRRFGPHWVGTSFAENVSPNVAAIKAGKGPRLLNRDNYQFDINYAYHIDAALLADFMRDFAVARGVQHISDDVVDVTLDESGTVTGLQLERAGHYPVEFVVDCTGFKSLIWSRMEAEPFISAGDRLLNDRAIPVQIPHRDPTKIEPCTRATALGAGWVWRVPLYSRIGTGYVYSSAFRTDDEARAEFLAHIRASGDLPAEGRDPATRVIKMRVGYTRQPWIKNCVAIGLSAGFVEPLEATAIYTIDAAAHRLVMNFPDKRYGPPLAREYNARHTALMEEIVNFLQVPYVTSNRTEPYWVAAREQVQVSEWLREKLELWQHRFPDFEDTSTNSLFGFDVFLWSMFPRGCFAQIHPPLERSIRVEDWKAFGQELKTTNTRYLTTLPSHYELLTNIRSLGAAHSMGDKLFVPTHHN